MKKFFISTIACILLLNPSINLEAKGITPFNIGDFIKNNTYSYEISEVADGEDIDADVDTSTDIDADVDTSTDIDADVDTSTDIETDTPTEETGGGGTTCYRFDNGLQDMQTVPCSEAGEWLIDNLFVSSPDTSTDSSGTTDTYTSSSSTDTYTSSSSTNTYYPSTTTDSYYSSDYSTDYSSGYEQDYELSDEEMAEVHAEAQKEIKQKEKEKEHQAAVQAQKEEDKNRRAYAFFLNDTTHKTRLSSALIAPEYHAIFILLWLIVITIIYWTGCMTFYFKNREKFKKEEEVFDFEKEYALQNGLEYEEEKEEIKNLYTYSDNQYINEFMISMQDNKKKLIEISKDNKNKLINVLKNIKEK